MPAFAVKVDMSRSMDPPLVKKYGVFNSGIVPQSRYTPGEIQEVTSLHVKVGAPAMK